MSHQIPEIVHSSKFGSGKNGYMLCEVIKVHGGYLKKNTFPNGNVYEEDMTEEEFHQFLLNTVLFESLPKYEKEISKKK